MRKYLKLLSAVFSKKRVKPLIVFGREWFLTHASSATRRQFESDANGAASRPIYHITNEASARSICESKKIYGVDVVSSAHFHNKPDGASRQALVDGMLLGFTWSGPVVNVDLSGDGSTHADQRPNILFDVPISKSNKETWELRLYPGSCDLMLAFVELKGQGFLLNHPLKIEVIHG